MNIAELEALKAVAETGSFTRAANHLGMSQPGLSRQIQRLERELGTRLLGGRYRCDTDRCRARIHEFRDPHDI